MSSTPNEILDLACKLALSSDGTDVNEVTLRCSTSRAYYAAMHAADESLPADLSPSAAERKSKSSHQAVIDAVLKWANEIRPGRTEARTVARNLPRLRDARKRADYKISEVFTLRDAESALRIARSTLQSAARAAEMSVEKQA